MATIVSSNGFKLLLLVFIVLTVATIIDVIQDSEIRHDHGKIKYFLYDNNQILEKMEQTLNKTST